MSIEFISCTPGSGSSWVKLKVNAKNPFISPLPCVCCGEDSVKDNLCQSCLDSLHKDLNHDN